MNLKSFEPSGPFDKALDAVCKRLEVRVPRPTYQRRSVWRTADLLQLSTAPTAATDCIAHC